MNRVTRVAVVLVSLCAALSGLPVATSALDARPNLTGAVPQADLAQTRTTGGENYWQPNGVLISGAGGVLGTPAITTDGAAGAILAWSDCQEATGCDVFAQRISAAGQVQWAANGVALSHAPGDQVDPLIVSDGVGGALVAWTDDRSGADAAVFAQHVTMAGSVLWASGGLTVTAGVGDRVLGALVADGAGGAFVLWEQARANDAVDTDLFAQRLAGDGAWYWSMPVTVTAAAGEQYGPQAAADGSGGVIVTWGDLRQPSAPNVYAQRITANGVALWATDGVPVSVDSGRQSPPARLAADGAGGAWVVWQDFRLYAPRSDVYMQRLSATGQREWDDDRAIVADPNLDAAATALLSDGSGGVIVLAKTTSGVTLDADVLAQRVGSNGQPLWGSTPLNLTPWSGRQLDAVGVADGLGGAYVAWTDLGSDIDVWAQHLGADGSLWWAGHGVAVATSTGDQKNLAAVSDGQFGLIVGWQDNRNDPDSFDLYAQRVGDHTYRQALPLIRF